MSQSVDVKVPDIGDFKDVPVIEVLVKPGDTVKPEDALVTLESDKATMDVPSPAAGTVKSIAVKVGDKVSEGAVVLVLETAAAAAAAAPAKPAPAKPTTTIDNRQSSSPASAPGAAGAFSGTADLECDLLAEKDAALRLHRIPVDALDGDVLAERAGRDGVPFALEIAQALHREETHGAVGPAVVLAVALAVALDAGLGDAGARHRGLRHATARDADLDDAAFDVERHGAAPQQALHDRIAHG